MQIRRMNRHDSFFRKHPVLTILATAFLAGGILALAAGLLPERNPRTPSGLRQFSSRYVTMRDGIALAVRVALPSGLEKGGKVPAIMESTRYINEYKPTFLLRLAVNLGLLDRLKNYVSRFLEAGYAYVAVDARGSGASFGERPMELSREEVADLGEVIDWIAAQQWSDGGVGAYGVSYSADAAEFALSCGRPALKAAALLYPDFDPIAHNAMPGGVFSESLLRGWSSSNASMDSGGARNAFVDGVAPVDGDRGGALLERAIAGHRTLDISEALARATYVDDELAPGYDGPSLSPRACEDRIEASGVPLYVRVGWMDAATAYGALERFLTFSNPQELVIGPWGHAGWTFYDPYIERESGVAELDAAQSDEAIAFFDRHLKEGAPAPAARKIRYYVFGSGEWKETDTWPAPGGRPERLYFGSGGALLSRPPAGASGSDAYRVDFSASTGSRNRWRTNFGGGRIDYPDRAAEDARLLTYASEPLSRDMEIVGSPVATLSVSSSESDGAFYVYLEDVAPDGSSTYISEGQLRALQRRVEPAAPGLEGLGPRHSLRRADGEALRPGEIVEMRIALQPTAVLIREGHRIRVAVAGHDASNFVRLPAAGDPVIQVYRNAGRRSLIELPTR
jgi:uncharacterized protein